MSNHLNSRNKLIAAMLAFFLGWLGFHKFYLGQITGGVIYLLLCWTFIPMIVAFIETIILLSMSDEVFDKRFRMD